MFDWLLYKGEKNWDTGFTLVEVMVSLALFSSVVTMAVGTLVVLIDANSKAQNAQLAVTNVSFALDSMTREIRTGLNYYCLESNLLGSNLPDGGTSKQNCLGGANALVFTESGSSLTSGYGSNRIAYRQAGATIQRRLGSSGVWQQLTAEEVNIEILEFTVTNTLTSDNKAPTVTIFIVGTAGDVPGTDTSFELQTTVTQQALDV